MHHSLLIPGAAVQHIIQPAALEDQRLGHPRVAVEVAPLPKHGCPGGDGISCAVEGHRAIRPVRQQGDLVGQTCARSSGRFLPCSC